MPEALLTIFRVCLLILLYLFFFRVLRAVWTEVNSGTIPATGGVAEGRKAGRSESGRSGSRTDKRTDKRIGRVRGPALPGTGPPSSAGPSRGSSDQDTGSPARTPVELVAIEPAHLGGLRYKLVSGMTFGRGSAASVVMDDSFLSQQHVEFDLRGGKWFIADLGSTNGSYLNDSRLEQPTGVQFGDRVRIGNIVLEVR